MDVVILIFYFFSKGLNGVINYKLTKGEGGGQALGFSFINLFEQQYILTCLSSDCNVIMLLYTDQGNRIRRGVKKGVLSFLLNTLSSDI